MKSRISLILLLFLTSYLIAQQDIKVISSDFNSIVIEYSPIYADTSLVKFDNTTYRNVEIFNGIVENSNNWGLPAIELRKLTLGVPSEFGNTIEVLSSAYKEISGQILPNPYLIPDSIQYFYDYKKSSQYSSYVSNPELVTFGEFGLSRNINTQIINLYPVKFDPTFNKIKLYTQIIFRVNFSGSSISNKQEDNLLKNVLVNYNTAKYWSTKKSNMD
jgi:hypothetical protein